MKKRSLLFVLAFVLVFVLVLATGCDNHEHSFGDWSITTQPTETVKGEATRTCSCGEVEKQELAVLTDTSVWTLKETPATHEAEGKKVYTSTYGTVEITIPKLTDHVWGKWTISTKPTMEQPGQATRNCACGESENKPLPVLTDTSVWTKDTVNSVAATCKAQGKDVYTSDYGTVEVALEKADHTYGDLIPEKPAVCETNTNGTKAHFECSFCYKLFVEKDGAKVEVTAADLVIVAEHSLEYKHDETQHWQECSVCDYATEKENHNFVDGICVCGAEEATEQKGTLDNPYTVTEALAEAGKLAVGDATATKVYVTAKIKSIGTVGNYLQNVYLVDTADSSTEILLFTCNLTDKVPAVYVNDTVVVLGYLKNYDGTLEIVGIKPDYATFESRTAGTSAITSQTDGNATVTAPESGTNGETFTFTVAANIGFEVAKVTVNGIEVTAENGTYTATVAGPTTIAVETKKEGAAEPEDVATLTFPDGNSQKVGSYTTTWSATIGNNTWTIANFNNNNNNWAYIKAGRKTDASTAYISTNIAESVCKVVVKVGALKNASINYFNLVIATDADFTNIVETVTADVASLAVGDLAFAVANPAENLYYKIIIDFNASTNNNTNGQLQINSVTYFAMPTVQHELGEVITGTATCDEAGTRDYRVCSHCGVKFIEIEGVWTAIASDEELQTPALGHNWTWVVKSAATCVSEGREREECSRCGEIHLDENGKAITRTTPKTEHQPDESTMVEHPADCTNAGYKTYTCSVCKQQIREAGEAALGHSTTTLLSWITAPTLTEGGEGHFRCHCGAEWDSAVAALSDTTVWTVGEIVTAQSYNSAEITKYNATFGSINVQTKAKLVAPYDGKTYVSVRAYIDTENNTVDTWSDVGIMTVDSNSIGCGDASPFRGKFVFTMVDEATGKFTVTCYDIKSSSTGGGDDSGWGESDIYSLREAETPTEYEDTPSYTYTCWIDWETGVFTLPNTGANTELHICIPSETVLAKETISASFWDTMMAISYTDAENNVLNMFSTLSRVYFGVTFSDLSGNELAAADCSAANYVRISDSQGNLVKAFGRTHDETNRLVETDGLEGTYTNGDATLVLDGVGGVVLTVGETITESLYNRAADGENFTLSCIIGNVYKEITLSEGTYTENEPKVSITFDVNGTQPDVAVENIAETSKFVPVALPTELTNETKVFVGWFTDVYGNYPVQLNSDGLYVPTSDVTLYAKWSNKVTIYLQNVLPETSDVLFMGDGDNLLEKLPNYVVEKTFSADGKKYFAGWYYIIEGEEFFVDESIVITQDDTGTTIIAKWEDVPVWAGTYYGTELWNKDYGNREKFYVDIDFDGKIISEISEINGATVSDYDATTQKLTYRKSNGTERYCYLDAELGVIAGLYSTNVIGNDYYILSRSLTESNFKVTANFGVNTTQPGSTLVNYYLQFVTLPTLLGEKTVVLYNNHIYDDATITTATGEVIASVDDVKNSKTVVVTANGERLVAVASTGDSFTKQTKTVNLDNYFGTYTSTDKADLVLDGAGAFVWGEKTGTYALVSQEENRFDMYVVADKVNTEYYELTLIGKNYVVEKKMSDITFRFVAPDGATLPDNISRMYVNTNIAFALPDGNTYNTAFVFNGFFLDAECTQQIVGEYTPAAQNITIYAKYSNPAVLTLVFNDGTTANKTIRYSVGDTATIEVPVWEKHALVGWFLLDGTESGEWGEEWKNGSVINADTTICAKWETAPIYNQTYGLLYISGTDNGHGIGRQDLRTPEFSFDPYGVYTHANNGVWPLNTAAAKLVNFDKSNGTIVLNTESTQFNGGAGDHNAFIDLSTGLIVVNFGKDNANWTRLLAFVPGLNHSSVSNYNEAYWNEGNSRAITFTVTVNEVATNYAILVSENHVYFGDAFVDGDGNQVDASKALELTTFSLKNGEDVITTVHPCFTLTLVYGNGFATEQVSVLSGAFSMSTYQPAYTNGQIVTGWYTTATFDAGTEFIAENANANTTVYAKWEEHAPYVISTDAPYAWTEENGVWSSGNSKVNSSSSVLTITSYADLALTFAYGASGELNCDYLYIAINDKKEYDRIGSLDDPISFKTLTLILKANDVVTFTYKKDSSADRGLDKAQVKDITFGLIVPVTLTYNFNIDGRDNVVVDMQSYDTVTELLQVTESFGTKEFVGWYTTETCDEGTEYVAGTVITESTVVYAKWMEKVTLTIVYGNGLADDTIKVFPGELFDLAEKQPSYTDGLVFAGWYTTAECTEGTEFTSNTISESTTIYCKWTEGSPVQVKNSDSRKWIYNSETGIWETNNAGYGSSNCTLKITALADVTITFDYTVSSESGWDKFTISIGSSTKVTESGEVSWKSVSYTLTAGQVLSLRYAKDNSGDSGKDMVQIRNLKVNGADIVAEG